MTDNILVKWISFRGRSSFPSELIHSNSVLKQEVIIWLIPLSISFVSYKTGLAETGYIVFILTLFQYVLRLHSILQTDRWQFFIFISFHKKQIKNYVCYNSCILLYFVKLNLWCIVNEMPRKHSGIINAPHWNEKKKYDFRNKLLVVLSLGIN